MTDVVRAHVVLPRELVEGVDAVVGQRRRSQFVAEAVEEKLAHVRRRAALRDAAGSIDLAQHPEWSTPEKISEWVHNLRRAGDRDPWRDRREGPPE